MSQNILAQLRKAREVKVKIGALTFICKRPTDEEALRLNRDGADYCQISKEFVQGWEGVTEDHVLGGGGGTDPVAFDSVVWREWCVDRPDFWKPIGEAILESYTLHYTKLQEAEKNSLPG